MKGKNLTKLSVEIIVDCDGTQDPSNMHSDCGVYGGWPYLAFEFVQNVVCLFKLWMTALKYRRSIHFL